MWPRSLAGCSSHVPNHDSSAPSVDVRRPVTGSGKISLIRWS